MVDNAVQERVENGAAAVMEVIKRKLLQVAAQHVVLAVVAWYSTSVGLQVGPPTVAAAWVLRAAPKVSFCPASQMKGKRRVGL
eukprot:COSAG01_NODE_4373_length_5087_cov_14.679230_2_plen_83_part_00